MSEIRLPGEPSDELLGYVLWIGSPETISAEELQALLACGVSKKFAGSKMVDSVLSNARNYCARRIDGLFRLGALKVRNRVELSFNYEERFIEVSVSKEGRS